MVPALAVGEALDAWTPITRLTHDLFTEAAADGHSIQSAAPIAWVYEQWTGSKVVNDVTTEA